MPTDPSLEAFNDIKPDLSPRKQRIVETLQKANRPLTTREIYAELGSPDFFNAWQPRVSELADAGVLVKAETRQCTVSGYQAICYEVDQ